MFANKDNESKAIIELSGYTDLGMVEQAEKLIGQLLEQPGLSAGALNQVVISIGMGPNPKKWTTQLEAAYARLTPRGQRQSRSWMLDLFSTMGDWKNAARFLSIRSLREPHELCCAMRTLLALDRLTDAETVARKCEAALTRAGNASDQSLLVEALASYYARSGDWPCAFEFWRNAPRAEVFATDAVVGMVHLCIVSALNIIRDELKTARELELNGETEISLPGLEKGLRQDTEKELLKLKQALEKIVPKRRRKDLGFERVRS